MSVAAAGHKPWYLLRGQFACKGHGFALRLNTVQVGRALVLLLQNRDSTFNTKVKSVLSLGKAILQPSCLALLINKAAMMVIILRGF